MEPLSFNQAGLAVWRLRASGADSVRSRLPSTRSKNPVPASCSEEVRDGEHACTSAGHVTTPCPRHADAIWLRRGLPFSALHSAEQLKWRAMLLRPVPMRDLMRSAVTRSPVVSENGRACAPRRERLRGNQACAHCPSQRSGPTRGRSPYSRTDPPPKMRNLCVVCVGALVSLSSLVCDGMLLPSLCRDIDTQIVSMSAIDSEGGARLAPCARPTSTIT